MLFRLRKTLLKPLVWLRLCIVGLVLMCFPTQAAEGGFDHQHTLFDELLKQHVAGGQVDYGGLLKKRSQLDRYLQVIADLRPQVLAGFTSEQQLAFWINSYNAITLGLVLDHPGLNSIRQIAKGDPWKGVTFKIAGHERTLDAIEHAIIRPTFQDARIHFALVCAAKSCPPLQPRAYVAHDLQERLNVVTRSFLQDRDFNRVNPERVAVTALLDWYHDDFVGEARKWLERPLKDYAPSERKKAVACAYLKKYGAARTGCRHQALIFQKYDWSLNGSW